MAKKEEKKIILERTYIIPLRRECMKVARYRKAKKAMKYIREFLARHMQVREQPEKKIKLSRFLNEAIWFRGIKKPPAKVKVKAIKYSDGNVEAELVELPKKAQITKTKEEKEEARKREEAKTKEQQEAEKKAEEKTPEKIEEEKRRDELKREERLLEKEHKEVKKEKMEVEHELIKPKVKVQPRMALQK